MSATLAAVNRSRPSAKTAAATAVVMCLVLLVTGCAADGRDLRATEPWQTTTTRALPATSAPDQEASSSGFQLSSPDFAAGGPVPATATCAGGNTFPNLVWTDAPPLAVELVLTLSDQTDPLNPTLLWLLAGIEPELGAIEAGVIPVGGFETLNGFNNPGFGTPCLETMADGTRDLQFRLYVMARPSGLFPGQDGGSAWSEVSAGALESTSLLARACWPGRGSTSSKRPWARGASSWPRDCWRRACSLRLAAESPGPSSHGEPSTRSKLYCPTRFHFGCASRSILMCWRSVSPQPC